MHAIGSPEFWIQQLINALGLGSQYALMAVGLAMVFAVMRLINFAHGTVMMWSAYIGLLLLQRGLPFPLVAAGAILGAATLGALMERIAYRPIRGAPDVTLLLNSFAVAVFLENLAVLLFSPRSRPFPMPALLTQVLHPWGDLFLPSIHLWAFGGALLALGGLAFFVTRTRVGLAMRAAAENPTAAQLMGIEVGKVTLLAFVIGSAMAGLAVLFWVAHIGTIQPGMGFEPVLKAFVACVIGGFGTIPGAVLGGYLLGALEILLQGILPSVVVGYRDALVYAVLILLLLVRPGGVLGYGEAERV
ncbi:branched-chain amino acid ABC transporter permease [Thermoflexus hugenholtzii]|uniref:Amino acid/amide ABC transporter membrane protein 1, HAAT family n=1 Tax=Thermoflexus hugenholtzii JAD2 TaxID=877466 RepID=A0A212PXT1_9CHLR|nr:branched-chain amino acid ABC transporter permease [Thermoflexus hugenholtzii]SNB51756.1 amino acid/amide ABC transporter membrane protein 1, HAAT family [Thermoflexus hugenholtzii JAD2]